MSVSLPSICCAFDQVPSSYRYTLSKTYRIFGMTCGDSLPVFSASQWFISCKNSVLVIIVLISAVVTRMICLQQFEQPCICATATKANWAGSLLQAQAHVHAHAQAEAQAQAQHLAAQAPAHAQAQAQANAHATHLKSAASFGTSAVHSWHTHWMLRFDCIKMQKSTVLQQQCTWWPPQVCCSI